MSEAATVTPPPMAPTGAGRLDDFSDKLSPMLVKELRQGLRGKMFVIVFLGLQALMALVLLIVVSASSPQGAGPNVSGTIFFLFSLAVLVAQPLRGIGALHNEIKGSTIDLMVLTRLGAWRIVLGKWVAIVSQSALLLTAITPYLILRYFFGRMNLFAELLLLALVFLGSAVFTAITVGLSAIPSILVRGLLPLAMGVFIVIGIFGVIFDGDLQDLIEVCSLQDAEESWGLLAGVVAAAYIAWSALAFCASMIAPMAENHSTVRRLLALAIVVAIGIIALLARFHLEVVELLLVAFCAPAIALALTEPLQLLPPICRPFLRFGTIGRLAGRVLYPGWPSGVLFTGILMLIAAGVYWSQVPRTGISLRSISPQATVTMFAVAGTLLLPALILRLFEKKIRQTFTFYLVILVSLCGLTIALGIIAQEVEKNSFLWAFSWLPPAQGLLMAVVRDDFYQPFIDTSKPPVGLPDFTPVIISSITTTVIYFGALLVCAVKKFPLIREVEDQAEGKTVPEP